jgi:hypothetical protein
MLGNKKPTTQREVGLVRRLPDYQKLPKMLLPSSVMAWRSCGLARFVRDRAKVYPSLDSLIELLENITS